ncbi:hypothetical protein [Streptomyces sp. NPDC008125]|uniref:hypothetical protein n=1 Tax=Streptomyces sp. NPDC008125 TaxID=3364811 RepID=UPI0036EC9442
MSVHEDEMHYGFACDLSEYGTALWLRWAEMTVVDLVVLPDCPAVAPGADGDACCLFAGHPERHTWKEALEEVAHGS